VSLERVSAAVLTVLKVVLALGVDNAEFYGGEACEFVNKGGLVGPLPRNTVYRILNRLEREGYLTSQRETGDQWHARQARPETQGPPRKYYRINPERRVEIVHLLSARGVPLPEVAW
jgi:DNA-binding transcriptional ArsR family regulator